MELHNQIKNTVRKKEISQSGESVTIKEFIDKYLKFVIKLKVVKSLINMIFLWDTLAVQNYCLMLKIQLLKNKTEYIKKLIKESYFI